MRALVLSAIKHVDIGNIERVNFCLSAIELGLCLIQGRCCLLRMLVVARLSFGVARATLRKLFLRGCELVFFCAKELSFAIKGRSCLCLFLGKHAGLMN